MESEVKIKVDGRDGVNMRIKVALKGSRAGTDAALKIEDAFVQTLIGQGFHACDITII